MISGKLFLFGATQATVVVLCAQILPLLLSVATRRFVEMRTPSPCVIPGPLAVIFGVLSINFEASFVRALLLPIFSFAVFGIAAPLSSAPSVVSLVCLLFVVQVILLEIFLSFLNFVWILFVMPIPVLPHARPTPTKSAVRVPFVFIELIQRFIFAALTTHLCLWNVCHHGTKKGNPRWENRLLSRQTVPAGVRKQLYQRITVCLDKVNYTMKPLWFEVPVMA